jgi:putative ABC transport system permease protein
VSEPAVYQLKENTYYTTLRAMDNIEEAKEAVKRIWKQYFPDEYLVIHKSQDFINLSYEEDIKLSKMLMTSAVVSLIIASFGIYVLAAYSVRRRSRELVLRKLFGTNARKIGFKFGIEFFLLILIATIIAAPIAWLSIENYLATFVDKATISLPSIFFALLFTLLIAFISVFRHIRNSMKLSPTLIFREL